MRQRTNYYEGLAADYSKPEPIPEPLSSKLLEDAWKFIRMKEKTPPAIGPDYSLEQVERENKEWWPTHCECFRKAC